MNVKFTDHLLDGTWISPSFRISDETSALVFGLTSDKYSSYHHSCYNRIIIRFHRLFVISITSWGV